MTAGRRRWAVLGGAGAVVLLGLIAEWHAYGPEGYAARGQQPWYPWLLDFVTGAMFAVPGAFAAIRRPASLVGPLLMLTAVAWFVATLVQPSRFVGTELTPSLVFLYRGFLAHAIVAFPSGRPADRVEWLAVVVAYGTSVLAPLWYAPVVGVALVAFLVGVAWRGYRRAPTWLRAARRDALTAAVVGAVTVVVLAAGRVAGLPYPLGDALTIGFHLVLMGMALGLTSSLVRSERAQLTDLVVELGESSWSSVGSELSRVMGDPGLRIGTWDPASEAYLDEQGPVLLPNDADPSLGATRVDRDGEPLALIVHQRGMLDDPEQRQAVMDAVRLAVANERLRARVEAQVAELTESRRRLVLAADAEGRRLEQRLREGAMRHLGVVGARLDDAARVHGDTGGSDPASTAIERAQQRLLRVEEDLRRLAAGLFPRTLAEHGLEAALIELGQDCPIPVEPILRVGQVPPDRATDAYLACAEALSNVTKHARATRARLEVVEAPGRLTISVSDDGAGGAATSGGSGLRGLADRLASVGGTLVVADRPGGGTRLTATLPLAETRKPDPVISRATTDGASAPGS